jgi:hypothetical protein
VPLLCEVVCQDSQQGQPSSQHGPPTSNTLAYAVRMVYCCFAAVLCLAHVLGIMMMMCCACWCSCCLHPLAALDTGTTLANLLAVLSVCCLVSNGYHLVLRLLS